MTKIIYQNDDLKNLIGCTLTYGHFSSIHPGHIRYLKYAKSKNLKLVVALLGDNSLPKKEFHFQQEERANSLEMFSIIDYILCLNDNDISKIVKEIKPKNFILGTEYKTSLDPEIKKALKMQINANRIVEFHAGVVNYSSTDLLNNTEFDLSNKRKNQFLTACKKQGLTKESLFKAIDELKNTKIMVIGDTILDQYSACEPLGISAEAPVVVVKELENKNFVGGAAIVASHIKGLGGQCNLLSVVGDDITGEKLRQELKKQNIRGEFLVDTSRPTTFKKRYVVENQKLFRVSRLDDRQISEEIENQLIKKLEDFARHTNCIVISDFVYGVITEKIISKVKEIASKYKIPILADIQCSSQIGSLMKFSEFTLLCPNEKEARIGLQDNNSGVENISRKLIKSLNLKGLIMKLGPDGFISYDFSNEENTLRQAFPALTVNPIDVAGAGDSLLAIMATGLASNHKIMETSALACCMAAISVKNMGNLPIKSNYLKTFLKALF